MRKPIHQRRPKAQDDGKKRELCIPTESGIQLQHFNRGMLKQAHREGSAPTLWQILRYEEDCLFMF